MNKSLIFGSRVFVYITQLLGFYKLETISILLKELIFYIENILKKGQLKSIDVYGYRMLIPLGVSGIGRALHVYKGREFDHKWILEQILKDGDVIFDLGANIGYYPMLENAILKGKCNIFSVEPDSRNIKVLQANISEFNLKNIQFEQLAISNFTGEAELIFSDQTNLNKLSLIGDNANSNEVTVNVPVVDFSEYIRKIGHIDVLRMDIEGAEVNIFNSLVNNYEKDRSLKIPRKIVFETHFYDQNKEKMKSYLSKMIEIGYKLEFLSSDDEHHKHPFVRSFGYKPFKVFYESSCSRGMYIDISDDHIVELISNWKGTRTVCFSLD